MTLDLLIDTIGIIVLGLFIGVMATVFVAVVACAVAEAIGKVRTWKR